MRLPLAASLLALMLPLAGCIAVPPDAERASPSFPDQEPPADRIDGMTADETREDTAGRCEGSTLSVPPGLSCAKRVLTVEGRIGVDRLPVELLGANGAIVVQAQGAGDAWGFVVTLKTRGLTEADARRALDEAWAWSHEGPDGHHLKASPTGPLDGLDGRLEAVQYHLTLPAWVRVDLTAQTTNGAVAASGIRGDALHVQTTNGAVTLHARVRDATVETTNGAITGTLLPTASGAWSLRTTNGAITLIASENFDRGYAIDARTTNGRIVISLHDGDTTGEGTRHQTFRTRGFDAREVQTTIAMETTNGSIVVEG